MSLSLLQFWNSPSEQEQLFEGEGRVLVYSPPPVCPTHRCLHTACFKQKLDATEWYSQRLKDLTFSFCPQPIRMFFNMIMMTLLVAENWLLLFVAFSVIQQFIFQWQFVYPLFNHLLKASCQSLLMLFCTLCLETHRMKLGKSVDKLYNLFCWNMLSAINSPSTDPLCSLQSVVEQIKKRKYGIN